MTTMQTMVLDPATHSTLRSEFRLQTTNMAILPNIRLGGLGLWNPNADVRLNGMSGLYSYIQAISLIIDGQTVCELRNAHVYLAYLAAVGSADTGDSVTQKLTFSNQKLVPYMQRKTGPAGVGYSVVNSESFVLPITAPTVESGHLYLKNVLPFLASNIPYLKGNQDMMIVLEYTADFSNACPLSVVGDYEDTEITRPYLMFESISMDTLKSMKIPDSTPIVFEALESDMMSIPAVVAAAAQQVTTQSRAFVTKSVSSILFCKTPSARVDFYAGGVDASYAQLNESIRVWVDGKQVTPLISNSALMTAYGPTTRAPVILQKPGYELYLQQGDLSTGELLGSRHWVTVPLNRTIEQSMTIDYARTGFDNGGEYEPGTTALSMYMFARVKKTWTWNKDGTFNISY